MKTLLICHRGADLTRVGIARWLASFSDLSGMIVLRENKRRVWRRIRREIKRVGPLRFVDVLAFRAYYRLFRAPGDRRWERERLRTLSERFPPVSEEVPVLQTHSPNTPEAERFVKNIAPDLLVARCKTLIKESVFSIPSRGTFVFHPGICPEYRNAHGCFWALATDDLPRVGMTLLRIDRGVDTGPVFGYYSYPYDEVNESHAVIQHRVVLDNLDQIREKLLDIYYGTAVPLDTTGRTSATWGQPWLTRYLQWKRKARQREYAGSHARLS